MFTIPITNVQLYRRNNQIIAEAYLAGRHFGNACTIGGEQTEGQAIREVLLSLELNCRYLEKYGKDAFPEEFNDVVDFDILSDVQIRPALLPPLGTQEHSL